MLSRTGAVREPAATEVCLEPGCLLLVGYVREHARCGVAVVAGDNQPASCRHALDHLPEGIGGQLLRGFTAELLKTIARLGKLVDAFIWPMVPKHNGRSGRDPVEAVFPRRIEALGACAWKPVCRSRAIVIDRRPLPESKRLSERSCIARNFRATRTSLLNLITTLLGFLQ